jgi:3-deoxy-manno-octulosonate cytidylyltransferase (CMP-KDO synthetase)
MIKIGLQSWNHYNAEMVISSEILNADTAVLAVIPARYASTRFPGKPLVEIAGKPMIQHVWERVRRSPSVNHVVIATDDVRIEEAAQTFGAQVCMTSSEHPSGTDRLWEAAENCPDYTWILNVQGDEPFIEPAHLETLLALRQGLQDCAPDILTLVTPFQSVADWENPNMVKAILSPLQTLNKAELAYRALYFSRSPMPYNRDRVLNPGCDDEMPPNHAFRHLGLYLYRRSALQKFVSLPPSRLEELERLEQLRALEAGLSIYAATVSKAPIGVDTPEDLTHLHEFLAKSLPQS